MIEQLGCNRETTLNLPCVLSSEGVPGDFIEKKIIKTLTCYVFHFLGL